MPKSLTLEEAFVKCCKEGKIIPIDQVNKLKIQKLLAVADADYALANRTKSILKEESAEWSGIYKLCFDALHELIYAFLIFEKMSSSNHQCLFAYICHKHPELELEWNFLERVRTRRNGANYYGTLVTYDNFKEDSLGFNLYINLLRKEILKRLKE